MDRWVVPLSIVAAAGDATQCYPSWAVAGANPATATPSDQVRHPCEGQIISLDIASNGADGGVLELYDLSGTEIGVNVSSATAITDAQLDAAVSSGKGRLILKRNFAGSGLTPLPPVGPAGFVKGLVARAVGATGTCDLNIVVHGGFRYLNGTT